jgi:hypothetical protein
MANVSCEHCGSGNDPERERWDFCVKCGKRLPWGVSFALSSRMKPRDLFQANKDADSTKSFPMWKWLVWVAGFVGGLVWIYFRHGRWLGWR